MTIRELNHKPDLNIKNATVTLNYNEIRDIANAFFYLLLDGKDKDTFKPSATEKESFEQTKKKFNILFDIVKNGCLTQFIIDLCATERKENEKNNT